jgi:rhodanese-related sulfurtransferase
MAIGLFLARFGLSRSASPYLRPRSCWRRVRYRDVVLYCTCPNEASSARATLMLRRKGINRVRPLAGGLEGWRDRGLP